MKEIIDIVREFPESQRDRVAIAAALILNEIKEKGYSTMTSDMFWAIIEA